MINRDRLILLLLSTALFLPFLGRVHLFDWDEINFAESAREMLLTSNWFQVQINFQPFWEKPPLFFWFQALAMKLFGVGEFAARLPNAICGIVTLQLIFTIGARWHGKQVAMAWAILYAGSLLPHLYFKSGIIDPWFNLFIFTSFYHLFLVLEHSSKKDAQHALVAGLFTGLAILTKGPVALLLIILTILVWLVHQRFKKWPKLAHLAWFAGAALIVSSQWFGYETITNGPWFLVKFVSYQVDLFLNPVAGHKQPFFYHFLVVLVGCFPLSVLAIPAFSKKYTGDDFGLSRWMKYLFWVVMVLFSIVTTKIVHYSSMAYLPLSYLAVVAIKPLITVAAQPSKFVRTWLLAQGLLIGLLFTLVPMMLLFADHWAPYIDDVFVQASLSVESPLSGWEWIFGLIYMALMVYIFRGWKASPLRSFQVLTLGTAFTIFGVMATVVPAIEAVSQGPAIRFFESAAQENVLVETYGYKSYAHYFYGEITPARSHVMDEHHLVATDIPIWISVKTNRIQRFTEDYPQAKHLYNEGGFSFYQLR